MDERAVTVVSGGMDSVTLAYYMKSLNWKQRLISFDYGQRHYKELSSASKIAGLLSCEHNIVSLTSVTHLLKSSLTSPDVDVPEGHYSAENMAITVVPNRNAIMLAIAYGVAVSDGALVLAYGAHAGDHAIYPDCRPEFVDALQRAFHIGNKGLGNPMLQMIAPFINKTKAEILSWGLKNNVPYEETWTCYRGGEVACGRCGTCVERLEAFAINNAIDPLPYADWDYWKTATAINK